MVPLDGGLVTLARPAAHNESGQNQERTGYRKHRAPWREVDGNGGGLGDRRRGAVLWSVWLRDQ